MKRIMNKGLLIVCSIVFLFGWGIPVNAIVYEYDSLNRLKKAEASHAGTFKYQYDSSGNVTRIEKLTGSDSMPNHSAVYGNSATSEGVAEGWNSFSTSGIVVQYNNLIENFPEEGDMGSDVTASIYEPEENVELAFHHVQEISAYATQPGGANVYQDVLVTPKDNYAISGWLRSASLHNTAGQVIVNYYDVNDQFIGHENIINLLQSTEWMFFQSYLTVPEEAVKARIHLQVLLFERESSGTVSFAEVLIKDYFDEPIVEDAEKGVEEYIEEPIAEDAEKDTEESTEEDEEAEDIKEHPEERIEHPAKEDGTNND